MISITQAKALIRLLSDAERATREHALAESYRADAMKAIGERLLAMYHRHQADDAGDLITEIITARTRLEDQLETEQSIRLPPRRAVRRRTA